MSEDAARADVWLWRARFFRTRALAARTLRAGRVRVDGIRIEKAHALLRPGAVLTFPAGGRVRVVEILALGERRGPAPEAGLLFRDIGSDRQALPGAHTHGSAQSRSDLVQEGSPG